MAEDTSVEIVQHPQEEVVVEPVAEQEQSAPQEAETASAEGEPEVKPESKTFTQEELDKILLREKRAVERKVRRELEESKPQPTPAKVEDKGAPNPDDYTDYTDYTKAVARYEARQEIEALNREKQEQENQRIQTENERNHKERIQGLIDKGESKYDDFHVKVPQSKASLAQSAMDAILECANAEDIVYFLATNDEEADRISSLSPAAQAKEIGKLEDRLSNTRTVKSSSAPPPPSLVKSGKTQTSNINEMTDEQYYEYRKKTGARWAQNR